jgi:hypothetical protein
MSGMRLRWVLALAALGMTAGRAAADDGGPYVGASVGYSSQFERAVVGLDFLVQVDPGWTVVPNVSYLQTSALNRWTTGVELQWNAPAHRLHRKLLGWAGGGLAIITEDPRGVVDPTSRDLVANAVAGVGYDAPASPFIQLRVTLRDPADVVLSAGVRF